MTASGEPVGHISEQDLAALIERRIQQAAAAGVSFIRSPASFRAHLIDVAHRAENTALRLVDRVPREEAPDPTVLFIAGAWHDGGKIACGEDYHEITSALDMLAHGYEWGLARAASAEAAWPVLRRAAAAVLPGFALHEQCQPDYVPTTWEAARVHHALGQLERALYEGETGGRQIRHVPHTLEHLTLMYSDMTAADVEEPEATSFEHAFERRWESVARRAQVDDPALFALLPAVRDRVFDGCALVERFLTRGFDAEALAAYRVRYSSPSACR